MPNPNFLDSLSIHLADATAGAAAHTVAVQTRRTRASGFCWRAGLIVTADESLGRGRGLQLTLPDGETVPATVVGRDASTDIALLRVEARGLSPIVLSSQPVRTGSIAIAVGSREGSATAAVGTIGLTGPAWRSLRGGDIDSRVELDVNLRRDAQGAAAIDSTGVAFGMAVAGPHGRVLVIPAATIERVAAKLQTHGRIARGYLGLGLAPVRIKPDLKFAAMVMSVDPEGPAAIAGVLQGDIVIGFANESPRGFSHLIENLGPESVGTSIDLRLLRSGQPLEVTLTIVERPQH